MPNIHQPQLPFGFSFTCLEPFSICVGFDPLPCHHGGSPAPLACSLLPLISKSFVSQLKSMVQPVLEGGEACLPPAMKTPAISEPVSSPGEGLSSHSVTAKTARASGQKQFCPLEHLSAHLLENLGRQHYLVPSVSAASLTAVLLSAYTPLATILLLGLFPRAPSSLWRAVT